ncbi:ubiquitin carboxyl-terminal hydrolase, putative [Theileria annulata]|uniref:Ubiquitin carboxyl-terminal hydrolase, putative n=1 Tax=Theileria annulata TaxID=5874 RepID=Q4UFF9_THEAN|nr:ubiquitin carboxyl-terminal hydrolase, putative [Theileria annulata]CAI74157.1 ubiquitin carboxyl-terminal hydrolase, putative [Theileria annulata]|eukprot:XP_951889.1 ubiquitin carboxyl-terminal hydrolase, putative [Theileria annulata]
MVGRPKKSGGKRSKSSSPVPKSNPRAGRSPKLKPVKETPPKVEESTRTRSSRTSKRSLSSSKSSVSPSKSPSKSPPKRAKSSSKSPSRPKKGQKVNDESVLSHNNDKNLDETLTIAQCDEPLSSQNESSVPQVPVPPKVKVLNCPYLGTINRHLLDFDFEKVCSITLSNVHVYACLVCGKYFQGRGKNTYCYTHALEECHYLFMNLEDCRVYCIPENYPVDDASLDDIKHFLKPVYTKKDVQTLSTQVIYGKALDGTDFIPGCIGLNNLKNTDYFNVIIQLICVVEPLRNLFLVFDVNRVQPPDPVIITLSQLIRKIFNVKNFKGIVSPHEFVQSVGIVTNGLYKIGVQSDPVSLLSWLLARIHQKLHNRNTKESVVTKTFGGELLIKTLKKTRWETERQPFRMLSLTVPEAPIFKDSMDSNAIPQAQIFELLSKYDGVTETVNANGDVCTYKLSKLPKYLILIIKRFTKNNFFLEKNPTIVSFPMKNLDLKDYVTEEIKDSVTRYDLYCNICHEGKPTGGIFKVHVYHAPSGNWFQMEDLLVTSILPQQVALTESYVQVYKRQDLTTVPEEEVDMFS